MLNDNENYIAVDLDGTLAIWTGWNADGRVGEPILPMITRVYRWRTAGKKVKIFTARANDPNQIPIVKAWLEKHNLGDLEITATKDYAMTELWDDRAVQVIPNTGKRADGKD